LVAALALANIGGDQSVRAVPVLREALKHGEPAVQRLASAALAGIGPRAEDALDDLVAVVADRRQDEVVRRNAALALVRLGDKPRKSLRTLLATLKDERQPEVLMYLIESLYEIADASRPALTSTEAAVPTLLRVVKDRKLPWMVRQRAVWKLGQHELAEIGAVPALEEVLKETGERERAVRYEAAVRLGIQLGPKASDRTVKVLLSYLTDPAMKRYAGSEAQVKSAGEGQGQSQVKELGTGDARLAPALALKHIGPKADQPEVIRALESAAESPDRKVNRVAREALKAIRRE
jgi:HEAT repeat protein